MADPTWPVGLPPPRQTGYGFKRVAPWVRTTMDSGQARQRRRFITTPTNLTASVRLTKAQLAAFESWWVNSVYDGQAWCVLPLINGRGKNNVRARFTDMYQVAGVDGSTTVFDVSLMIESLSMPVT